MKNFAIALVSVSTLALVGCSDSPMSDSDMAKKYNLSMEEYQEQKEAAARMNMTIEDHLGAGHGAMNH